MKFLSLSFIPCLLCFSPVQAITINAPSVATASFEISSPDDTVATLGKVELIIDLAAEHDSLFDLKIRRQGLTLEDGRPITVFGYDKKGGIIVTATAPVTYLSVAGVKDKIALVLFYNEQNEVIAPSKKDIRVFTLDSKALAFEYQPTSTPASMGMDVSILIDKSGSMKGHMPVVMAATRDFMANLPDFTRCHVLTFSDSIKRLTSKSAKNVSSCPDSLWVTNKPIVAGGGTALFSALQSAFSYRGTNTTPGIPHLVISLTDGVNNQASTLNHKQLVKLKHKSNSRLFTFWAGSYDASHLKGLADMESVSTKSVKHDLQAFFSSIGVSVSGLQTLIIK